MKRSKQKKKDMANETIKKFEAYELVHMTEEQKRKEALKIAETRKMEGGRIGLIKKAKGDPLKMEAVEELLKEPTMRDLLFQTIALTK